MPPLPSLTLRTAVPSLSSSAAASCCACKETVDEDGVIHMQVLMTKRAGKGGLAMYRTHYIPLLGLLAEKWAMV